MRNSDSGVRANKRRTSIRQDIRISDCLFTVIKFEDAGGKIKTTKNKLK